ncbi:MAG TPA: hypothetical protein ENJ45_00970, partial [Phaeodactylibacter sp.]|nr:hypothetical protein [Phaeodactylibacter sp.]
MRKYKHILFTILSLTWLLFFFGCAQPKAPIGGPKDENPPELIPDKSDANMQTRFDKRSFELTFNEWVQLNDVYNQVVVTPPLKYAPDIKLHRKTLVFTFDEKEQLRSDATYIINFGEAVKDFNEGLPAKNLRFVFSTGDYIDSLSVRGKVVDAFSGEGVKDILVMLYDNSADSVVYTERPFYFTRTQGNGNFKI